jgi:hypothetical protein
MWSDDNAWGVVGLSYDATATAATCRTEARAAAWAWYKRRLSACAQFEREVEFGPDLWPRALTWSDDQVAEVERWLVDSTAEMPEVLRG